MLIFIDGCIRGWNSYLTSDVFGYSRATNTKNWDIGFALLQIVTA